MFGNQWFKKEQPIFTGYRFGFGGGGGAVPDPINASGGTVTYAGGYVIHTFDYPNSDDFVIADQPAGLELEYLVVAGGGGGGQDYRAQAHEVCPHSGGGGGGGGFREGSLTGYVAGTYPIAVGNDGGHEQSGQASQFGAPGTDIFVYATGGGGGPGRLGGSGGGAQGGGPNSGQSGGSAQTSPDGISPDTQGYDGGRGRGYDPYMYKGGGGGGAGGVGSNYGGGGGSSVASSMSGSSQDYSDGGSSRGGTPGNFGGGGGAGNPQGNPGKEGVVIVRYLDPQG